MKSMKLVGIIATALICSPVTLLAAEGGYSGGGGDVATEARIDEIRSDLLKWVSENGPAGFNFPKHMVLDRYVSKMTSVLTPHAVVISSITQQEENETDDPDLKVAVNGEPKTCVGKIFKKDNAPHILCKVERFRATTPAEQYRLIHHEYAGLVDLEKNLGSSSDYYLSNQITDFLVSERVFRLSVKKRTSPLNPNFLIECAIDDRKGSPLIVSIAQIGFEVSGIWTHWPIEVSETSSGPGRTGIFGSSSDNAALYAKGVDLIVTAPTSSSTGTNDVYTYKFSGTQSSRDVFVGDYNRRSVSGELSIDVSKGTEGLLKFKVDQDVGVVDFFIAVRNFVRHWNETKQVPCTVKRF